jgi:hypothetical protein
MREWRARLPLIAAAVVPFAPALAQFVRQGVPDILFTGDGAALELGVRHAAHGIQFLGPYSPFSWSHPGPLFFYLALPFYALFHQRGPALNLFMLVANLIASVSVVLMARRMKGDAFAWVVAALLAVFGLVAMPFVPTGEWNPVAPLLPLILLSFLGARIAVGAPKLWPVYVFVASAIVQTHIGYLPEVLAISAIALAAWLWRLISMGTSEPFFTRPALPVVVAAVLIACWALPIYEAATHRPGNVRQLFDFFSAPHQVEHSWEDVLTSVFPAVTAMPVALAQTYRLPASVPGPLVAEAIVLVGVMLLVGVAAAAWRRHDAELGAMAMLALAEIVTAIVAVRAIRGEILPSLMFWVAVAGFMMLVALAAWITSAVMARFRPVLVIFALVTIALTLTGPVARGAAFRGRDAVTESLAAQIGRTIVDQRLTRPLIRIGSNDVWASAAGVILFLAKQRIPFVVEPAWAFMFGDSLVDPGEERTAIVIGDRWFADRAASQPQLTRLAQSGDLSAFIEQPGFLRHHRVDATLAVHARGATHDPHLAVDGNVPPSGTAWDSPASVVLSGTDSMLAVDVPAEAVNGVAISTDGNDLYRVRCAAHSDLAWSIGVDKPERGLAGMQVTYLFSDRLVSCGTLEIAPVSGDGGYSIGEVLFLHP